MLLALAAMASLASAQNERLITELQVKTADEKDASMTFGSVEVDVYTREPVTVCEIMLLDSAENDFQVSIPSVD